ncbi:MAG: VWA domain-containing protein [Gammaproteobacteria bacterium]
MSWANPWVLFALLLPAAAAWRVWRGRLDSKPLWPVMTRVSIGSNGSARVARPRKSDPAYLIMAAVALGVIALARPQWGEESEQSFSQSIEVVIALDLSRSMWTQDMPDQTARLRAAKVTIERLLDGLRGENVGLVVFAGTSFVQVPMSPDYQIIREFLPSLDPNYMPVGGTDYDRMLGSALEGFSQGSDRDRYLIVLSDGENTKPGLEPRIPELLRRSVHVIGIGFGTEQGATIPDQKGGQLLDKDKNPIVSRLTPAALQDLATRTEGQYAAATTLSDADDVRKLIKDTVESGRAGHVRNANAAVGVERFQWFLVPAVLLSLLSLVREFRRHPRPRAVRPAAKTEGTTTAVAQAAGMADTTMRTAAAALTVFVCALAPLRVQAHHNAEAGFEVKEEFKGDPAQRVRAIASHMGKLGYDPFDLELMVQAAMQFAISERARGRLPLEGVMHDAVEAAHMGKKLDPNLAQWDHYESQIHDLMAPLPVEAKAQDPENNDADDEDDDDEQNYKPVPLRKAKDKEGRDLFGKNTKTRSEFALGDLSGDETFAPQEPHGGRRRPPTPPQNPALTPGVTPADDPTMAEARKNFAIVVKADSPGRVHQLLNGDAKRAVEQDW